MALYNTDKYVGEAIESIIQSFNYAKSQDLDIQTYLIVRNDASKDNSASEVMKKVNKYNNVFLLENEKNLGILQTRRLLFKDAYNFVNNNKIKNEENIFLSFLDSDDICCENRVLNQLNYMMEDKGLKSCGGQVLLFKNDIATPYNYYGILSDYKTDYEHVKVDSIFQSSSLSPFMSFRYDWIKNRIENLNDSELWANYRMGEDWSAIVDFMGEKDFKYKNMDEVLIYYRKHEEAMTSVVTDGIGTDQYYIRNKALAYIGLTLTEEEHLLLITISPCRHWAVYNVDFFQQHQDTIYEMTESLIAKILKANEEINFYNQGYLKEYTDKIIDNIRKSQYLNLKNVPVLLKVMN